MKLHLTVQSGTLAGKTYELTTGFLTVGRGETCAVRFDPQTERIASKQHAYIEKKADGFYLIDNQSTNGTLLNGQKIQTSKLNFGDRIQFGKNGVEATVNLTSDPETSEPTLFRPNANIAPNLQSAKTQQIPIPADWRSSLNGLSVSHLSQPETSAGNSRNIFAAVTIFVILFLSFVVSLLLFASVGVVAAVVASVIAFVPAVFYILPLIWLDRYDPEPSWLLALAFAWGALVSVIVSFIINTVLGALLGDVFGAVISAPIFEEGSKGLGLVLLLIFFRKYFDDILDGIIFAGVIALGFATVENVLYYGREIAGGGNTLAAIFVIRGIFSPFAHVSFTAMTGIGCGISRESHNAAIRWLMPLLGYIGAVVLHAIWNGMATLGGLEGFIIGYIVLEVPFFLIFVGFAFYTMYRQNKILKDMLAIDVLRGTIPKEHLEISTSAFRSSVWILGSLFSGKFKARSSYMRAIGKLGLSYWHIQRATAAQGHTGSFQQNPILRDEVIKWRDKV